MKNKLLSLTAASLFFASAAQAELNYNYVEGGLGIWSSDYSQTYIGPDVRGSFAIITSFFLILFLKMF